MAMDRSFDRICCCIFYINHYTRRPSTQKKDLEAFTDVSHLMPVKIKKVVQGKEVDTLKEVLKEAKAKHLPISIAGKQHSMGGHTYYENGTERLSR